MLRLCATILCTTNNRALLQAKNCLWDSAISLASTKQFLAQAIIYWPSDDVLN